MLVASALAFEVQVDSFSGSEITLAFSGLETVDIRVTNVQATAESSVLSDSYPIQPQLSTVGDKVLLTADVSPIFEDYSREELQSILITGFIEIDEEQTKFAKRVQVRSVSAAPAFAAPAAESATTVYITTGLAIILVLLIIIVFFRKPKVTVAAKPKVQKKRKKRRAKTKKKKL